MMIWLYANPPDTPFRHLTTRRNRNRKGVVWGIWWKVTWNILDHMNQRYTSMNRSRYHRVPQQDGQSREANLNSSTRCSWFTWTIANKKSRKKRQSVPAVSNKIKKARRLNSPKTQRWRKPKNEIGLWSTKSNHLRNTSWQRVPTQILLLLDYTSRLTYKTPVTVSILASQKISLDALTALWLTTAFTGSFWTGELLAENW